MGRSSMGNKGIVCQKLYVLKTCLLWKMETPVDIVLNSAWCAFTYESRPDLRKPYLDGQEKELGMKFSDTNFLMAQNCRRNCRILREKQKIPINGSILICMMVKTGETLFTKKATVRNHFTSLSCTTWLMIKMHARFNWDRIVLITQQAAWW